MAFWMLTTGGSCWFSRIADGRWSCQSSSR